MQNIRDLQPGDRFQYFPRLGTFRVTDRTGDEITYIQEDAKNATPLTTRNAWKVWAL